MPNHCSNSLYIKGDKESVENFIVAVTKTESARWGKIEILKSLFPTPTALEETASVVHGDEDKQAEQERIEAENLETFGARNWYDWCIQNWGTKWGDYDGYLADYGDGYASFTFQSAWAPPVAGLTEVSKQFPTVTFSLSYYEEGMGFYGAALIKDGVCVEETKDIESIPGYSDFDPNNEDADFDKQYDLLLDASDELEASLKF